MTSKLTREENVQAVFDLKAGYTLGLADVEILKRVARIALAAMDSEPVAWGLFDFSNGSLHNFCSTKNRAEQYRNQVHQSSDSLTLEIKPLYRHAQPAPVIPTELHPDTQKLVIDFCTALAEKLYKAQLKYGYDADWKQDGWPSQCQAHFHQHVAKGDPRDVAAYCAFMWYHGWKTEAAQPAPVVSFYRDGIEAAAKWIDQQREAYDSEHGRHDPDTGSFEFGNDAQREYSSTLEELGEGIRGLHPNAGNSPVIPDAARDALEKALAAMEFMGDTLNNLDAVCSEDVEFVTPAFDAVRRVLAAAPQEVHDEK